MLALSLDPSKFNNAADILLNSEDTPVVFAKIHKLCMEVGVHLL
jgi:hypothetical protein